MIMNSQRESGNWLRHKAKDFSPQELRSTVGGDKYQFTEGGIMLKSM